MSALSGLTTSPHSFKKTGNCSQELNHANRGHFNEPLKKRDPKNDAKMKGGNSEEDHAQGARTLVL